MNAETLDTHPLMVFAKECVLGAYSEAELADAARRAINYALEAKNEPVAWANMRDDGATPVMLSISQHPEDRANWMNPVPLYTTPPQRKPLTDEEIVEIGTQCQWYDGDCERFDSIGFARAIEAKLKEKNT